MRKVLSALDAKQFKKFAEDCLMWARMARSETERRDFLDIASTCLIAAAEHAHPACGNAASVEGGAKKPTLPLVKREADQGCRPKRPRLPGQIVALLLSAVSGGFSFPDLLLS